MKKIYLASLVFSLFFSENSHASSLLQSVEDYKVTGDSCAKVLNYECAIQNYKRALLFDVGDSTLIDYLRFHILIADLYYRQGLFNQAHDSYQIALKNAELHQVQSEQAKALMGLSHIYWRFGDNLKSIHSGIKSIELFKSLKDTMNTVSASNILAGVYMSTGELKKAGNIYEETLALAIASKDSIGMASSYEYKGVVKAFEKKYDSAVKFYLKSLSINLKIGNEVDVGITYGNIGEAYNLLEKYSNALGYFEKAEEILTNHNFQSGLIFTNYSAGESLTKLGMHEEAHRRFNKSLALIEETGEVREMPFVLKLISECYAKEKKYKSAFLAHQKYADIRDSLTTVSNQKDLSEIMSKYEFEKKEQENAFLIKENEINARELDSKQSLIKIQLFIVGILLLFLIIAVYLFIKLYRNKVLLDNANETKNKLFGFIAHDIKAPLGNVQMLVSMMQQGFKLDKDDQPKILSELSNSAHAVVQLVDDLISWSISQRDGLVFHPENVIVGEIVKDNLELFQSQIAFKNLKISNKIEPYTAVYLDKKAAFSIIRNILSNAIKFSDKGGTITLNASEEDNLSKNEMVHIKIRDEGIGMSEEKADSLVSTEQFDSTRGTSNEKGTGLGLNLVKDFIQKSGGYIKIKSKPGKGTKFSIFLPAAKD